MSRRAKQAATSRRTRRAEQQQQTPAAAAFAGTPKILSNPIFFCEDGSNRIKPIDLRCGYGPGSVHNPDPAAASVAKPLPLPLPPSRTHRAGPDGTQLPALRVGPTLVMSPHGRALRRVPMQDPFLAAYVACTKSGGSGGGKNAAQAKKKQQQQQQKKRGDTIRGCGIWDASKKYTGVMSCKYGCAVTVQEDAPAATAAQAQAEAPAGPTLDLSRPLAVLPARERALERRRAQG